MGHAGQAGHPQQLRSNMTFVAALTLRDVMRGRGSERLNRTPGVTQLKASTRVRSRSDLDLADVRCAPTMCQGPGYYRVLWVP